MFQDFLFNNMSSILCISDPPGIVLEYELRDRSRKTKEIDLLDLTPETDVEKVVSQILANEPLIGGSHKPKLQKLVFRLIEKLYVDEMNEFYLFKILRAHILPLTNCAFNKSGDRFITGSYDRTCKVYGKAWRSSFFSA